MLAMETALSTPPGPFPPDAGADFNPRPLSSGCIHFPLAGLQKEKTTLPFNEGAKPLMSLKVLINW
jgi:hypothetical protein